MRRFNIFYLLAIIGVVISSCTTTHLPGISSSDMEVAASKPRQITYHTMSEVANSAQNAELVNNETHNYAPAAQEHVTRYTESIRQLSASAENKFTRRTLERVATHLDNVHVNKEKLSFFNHLRLKLFSKLMNRYMLKAAEQMDTADILAIVSLAAGCVAIVGYFYASILFGAAAIATGVIAIKKGTSRRGMAVAGIILGAVGIFLWFLLFLLFFAAWAIL